MSDSNNSHAVVIGASLGGLLAARALSEHYGRVTVLERDRFPADPREPRKGVPQGRHAHGLLGQGRLILDELFPGFTEQLELQGAERGDLGDETLWYHSAGFHRRHRSGIVGLFASRPLVEAHVRKLVASLHNVSLLTDVEAYALEADARRAAIIGVCVRHLGDSTSERIAADLVVDATGRGSRVPAWLEQLGFERPDEQRVNVSLSYTTRTYKRESHHADGMKGVVKAGTPSNSRGGAMLAIEGSRWIVSMGGYGIDHAALDDAGFLEYARGMGAPHFARLIESAEPLSPPATFRFPASVRRRYERVRRFPQGLLVFGDAICSFNPVYGQGITVAAMEALALRAELTRGTKNLATRFFAQAAKIVDIPWTVVVGADARILELPEHNTRMNRALGGYLDKLHVAALTDPEVAARFLRVSNLMANPTTLLRPSILWRVRRGARGAHGS